MKRVKRMRRCCLFILIVVILLSGCGGKSQGSTSSRPNDNASYNAIETSPDLVTFFKECEIEGLDFWILQDVKEYDFSGYTKDPNYLGTQGVYLGRNYDISTLTDGNYSEPLVEYFIGSWPDLSDQQVYITRIWITDPDVKIYGLSVENTMEEWRKVLMEKGYSFGGHHEDYSADMVADSPNGTYIICYNSNPRSLTIIAPTTNREGIVND